MEIAGSHAFITGGASGLGLAMARALATEGARVTVVDFDAERLDALDEDFARFALDVRDRAGWASTKSAAEATNGPVTILCNNAGIGPERVELADSDPARFDQMVAIKLTGTFNGIHAFAADMSERGAGHIVNTASMAGLETSALLGAYTAAKFAVVGLSEVLRKELGPHGVGVSVFCPGLVSTGLALTTAKATSGDVQRMRGAVMPGLDAAKAAARVVAGIEGNWPYILTHGERRSGVAERMGEILAAFDETPNSAEL